MKEVVEKDDYLKFHEHLVAGKEVGYGECYCLRAPSAREKFATRNVKFKEVPFTCDCGASFDLPAPLSKVFKEKEVSLTRVLLIIDLDHTRQLATFSSSTDQLGNVSCVSTAMPMCAVDHRARQITNDAYALLHFNQMIVLHDVRPSLLFSAFNYARVSADVAQHVFRELLLKMDNISDGDKNVVFDEQSLM